jgi:DeoR/GlpR family transcriptional regulator of sugar metabolism
MTTVLGSRDRREEIVNLATTVGLANVEDLSVRFGVTASTIRRDLGRLTAQGRLARTYGGAMAVVARQEASLRQRAGEAYESKHALARWAAELVRPGESLLLDAGSTMATLAHELRDHKGLRVATASLAVLAELSDATDAEVECLGGRLRPLSQAFVGPLTESALEKMTFDRVFMSADGVSAVDGVCEADLTQTRLKEVMASRSRNVYVLAHAAKIDLRPFHAWARFDTPWTLVTDDAVDRSKLPAFEAAGIDVVVVPVNPQS